MTTFAARVCAWHQTHGRHELPWQHEPTPYRVWVSEIMLQQTQVSVVVPYYKAFIARFPSVAALAGAPLDDVLHQWTGLGYYARARHLHRAAQIVMEEYDGRFPTVHDTLTGLPGIGRSTASAILALSCNARHAILDGNVKRVLARYHAVEGWPGQSAVERRLWALSERLTPRADVGRYTQAIMDLGATVCTRRNPCCGECPLRGRCRARRDARQHELPAPRPRRNLPIKTRQMLVAENEAREWLIERRPPAGIWGGLWAFPELEDQEPVAPWAKSTLGLELGTIEAMAVSRHVFTHFTLDLTPVRARVRAASARVEDGSRFRWLDPRAPASIGLAAPVRRLLQRETR